MSFFELLVIAVGLSMDAFAVSVCKGLSAKSFQWKYALLAGLWFGGFQGLMPAIGYLLGASFAQLITGFDHWIAFGLLLLIGGNMIKEAFSKDGEVDSSFGFKAMLLLAVATSIDALAVGVGFGVLSGIKLLPTVLTIGAITFLFSVIGVKVGSVFGLKYKSKAELCGGIILILMGIKILLEHLLG